MNHTDFYEKVWNIVSAVPPGKVISYGQLAILAGMPAAPRLAGKAMRLAPDGLPCHRVVHSDGKLCDGAVFDGFQRKMLESEGVIFKKSGKVDMKLSGYFQR